MFIASQAELRAGATLLRAVLHDQGRHGRSARLIRPTSHLVPCIETKKHSPTTGARAHNTPRVLPRTRNAPHLNNDEFWVKGGLTSSAVVVSGYP